MQEWTIMLTLEQKNNLLYVAVFNFRKGCAAPVCLMFFFLSSQFVKGKQAYHVYVQ